MQARRQHNAESCLFVSHYYTGLLESVRILLSLRDGLIQVDNGLLWLQQFLRVCLKGRIALFFIKEITLEL